MNANASITIDYKKNRNNPAEIFEAMALYINFYRDFSSTLNDALESKEEISISLSEIHEGSIQSIISFISKSGSSIPSYICDAAIKLQYNLNDLKEITDKNQIEYLIQEIERLLDKHKTSFDRTKINRKKLLAALKNLSDANSRIQSEEKVFIGNNEKPKIIQINTGIRIPPSFSFETTDIKHATCKDSLIPISTVNEGTQSWQFHSNAFGRKIRASIIHTDWLERYQNGLINPVGGKDTLIVELSYDIKKNSKNEATAENFRITKVNDVHRGIYEQYEITA